jgi:sulfide:quinone oxidoreductase
MTTTLVLGGGFGGLALTRALRARLPNEHRIVLVDRSPDFVVGAAKTWVMLGERRAEAVSVPRARLVPDGVTVVRAEVLGIDAARREAETATGRLLCDHLVLALGAELDPGAVPGLASAAHTFYTLDGAKRLRSALEAFDGGRVVLLIPRVPFMCPPAPYEAAMLLHDAFERRGIRGRTTLEVWTVERAPMMTAGPEIGAVVKQALAARDIGFHPLSKAAGIDGARRAVRFEDGSETTYDLLIAIPPHRVPRIVVDAGLAESGGWVEVDPATLEVSRPGVAPQVYAIGDLNSVRLPGRFDPAMPLALPKAGVFAAAQGEVLAQRIAASVLGEPATAAIDGRGFCYIEVGGGQAMRGDGAFFAMPHPVMVHRPPDAEQYREKLEWIEGLTRSPGT